MFIRYPGSKAKILRFILEKAFPFEATLSLWSTELSCYCEPFFGSGAAGWQLVPNFANPKTTVVINDRDPGVAALWKVVRDTPRELIRLIADFRPSTEAFYRFKAEDGDTTLDPVVLGFQKLALHQMSFSGLGYKSGGPLGGRDQRSEYNAACRWSPERIAHSVVKCHKLMRKFSRFDVCNEDFAPVLARLPPSAFVYLDPPYYVQGEALYRYPMREGDHVRLCGALRDARFRWVLSYDDHPRIRELYAWASIGSFEMTPTVQTARTAKRRKNREIVISSLER